MIVLYSTSHIFIQLFGKANLLGHFYCNVVDGVALKIKGILNLILGDFGFVRKVEEQVKCTSVSVNYFDIRNHQKAQNLQKLAIFGDFQQNITEFAELLAKFEVVQKNIADFLQTAECAKKYHRIGPF